MQKTMAIATFLALGAGAVGLSAAPPPLKGSDTLHKLMDDLLVAAVCPNAVSLAPYTGGGSGAGENNMVAGGQSVAPMSRQLGSAICTPALANPGKASQLALAGDAVEIVKTASQPSGKTGLVANVVIQVPQDSANPSSATSPYELGGVEPNKAANAWKEVPRLIYFGLRSSNFVNAGANVTPTVAVAVANRNCSDPVRVALANNYCSLFSGGCDAGVTGQLKHAFRRDENSGTTDTFRALLGLQDVQGTNGTPFCNEWSINTIPSNVSVPAHPDYYYNDNIDQSLGGPVSRGQTALLGGVNKDCVPTTANSCGSVGLTCTAATNAPSGGICTPKACNVDADCGDAKLICVTSTTASPNTNIPVKHCESSFIPGAGQYPAAWADKDQDADPLRRKCDGNGVPGAQSEQVCSWRGDLGLVLPVSIPPNLTAAVNFPAAQCDAGNFRKGAGIRLAGPDTNGISVCALCPNGALPFGTTWDATIQAATGNSTCQCLVPTTAAGDARCINASSNFPTQASGFFPPRPTPSTNPTVFTGVDEALRAGSARFALGNRDGRVYNLHVRSNASGSYALGSYTIGATAGTRAAVGAFYRLHMNSTLICGGTCASGNCCQNPDDTHQIGCLVEASPKSIGFSGSDGDDAVLNSDCSPATQGSTPLNLNGISGKFPVSPLSRFLYLNTVPGWPTSGAEFELARCMAGNGNGGSLTSTAALSSFVTAEGFVGLSSPGCVDFNEATVCGAASNTDSCPGNAAVGLPTGAPVP